MLISTILGYEDWAWRVVGISKEALHICKENDFKRPKGLVRDHEYERKETYKKLIEERLLFAYGKIRSNVKNGLAIVPIERGAAGGSYFTIPPQVQMEIASRKKNNYR